ncbi:MAG: S-methyl-5-thioribose-1-phosphate isomerase [Lachnospiraceae bacterium]|nr:S-methyl-5-thioribose-1-phosphate isomerase [Lachnospiraceae bacterium]
MDALQLDTVKLSEDRSYLEILDQTLLPGTIRVLKIGELKDVWEAINVLRVRGAPAIGVTAAYAAAMCAGRIETDDPEAFYREFLREKEYLATARPTAVNLFWALDRMDRTAKAHLCETVPEIKEALFTEAQKIRDEDVAISRGIGEIGFSMLHKGMGILTHCNAGTLATAKYGTATAPMYMALEHGWAGRDLHVYCDETRPLLQGARLTAFEMHNAGIATTLICDNMASIVMKQGKIDIVFVGCDRVARNGDFANKIGTSGVAILAKHYGIPFYVCAPSSTIDMQTPTGEQIPIEQRKPEEVTEMWYRERMAPEGVDVYNPAFDVTDHSLVTGIITEKGLCRAPFGQAFEAIGL